MKKGFYLDQEHKDEVVSSMAKKLADHDDTFVFKRKKKDYRPFFFVVVGFCFIGVIVVMALMPSSERIEKVYEEPAAPSCPVRLIESAYERGEIGVNEYGSYLTDILVRYDSIPEIYKVDRPMIIPDDIYLRLLAVWGVLRPDLRRSILEDIPQLESKIDALNNEKG